MDFFEHQDRARRNTWKLILFFVTATLLIVMAVNALAFTVWLSWQNHTSYPHLSIPLGFQQWLNNPNAWFTAGATILILLSGSLLQWLNLAKGGEAVARMADARPIEEFFNDPKATQFRNVVAEMAIASGVSAPKLYIMDRETGINAFVAGYQVNQAVMVVTRGMLTHLNREQIQGVVGHEFSHILNGDMRLNIRLMSMLAGIVMIGQFGRFMADIGGRSGYRSRRSRNNNSALPVFLAGLALMAIGAIGVFFGRLIRAAVSRQREFLADASSVQFTRNPEAVAGALYKIQKQSEGSLLQHRHAEDMSHFCFGNTVHIAHFNHLLATHPPLPERIKRIAPNFLARQRNIENRDLENTPQQNQAPEATLIGGMAAAVTGLQIQQVVGQTSAAHVDYAHQLYKQIPPYVRTLLATSAGARAFCYGVILKENDQQQEIVRFIASEDPNGAENLARLWKWQRQAAPALRLPCLELCIPALNKHTVEDILIFLQRIQRLCEWDQQIVLMEWIVLSLLDHHLNPAHKTRDKVKHHSLKNLGEELQLLLSSLVYLNTDLQKANNAYKQAMTSMGFADRWLLSRTAIPLTRLQPVMTELNGLSFILKKTVIQACSDIILSDQQVNVSEYDCLRTIATVFGCPMPPLILEKEQLFGVH
ncbi:M48 family metallopeptidase [Gynuella sunshinyii]|uniref:Zn-dependent protease with chaperone function n=1 Tax=Gynuella sunshinyii YC6258 TaxID=1445510 RepID=A0A0C5V4G5_9GAMM|nr:M48 family metallopeptidase [Gynuella sunshinyii]AJQ94370.1 Zn-dependent protease with chaperone function [Gynuella sunshinyii YC6258]